MNGPTSKPNGVKASIDSQFRQQRAVTAIINSLKFSPSAASRLFKVTYGLAPVQYRNRLRMMQASTDLIFGAPSIEATQHAIGINDSSYFYQSFRDQMKTTPSSFRTIQFGVIYP